MPLPQELASAAAAGAAAMDRPDRKVSPEAWRIHPFWDPMGPTMGSSDAPKCMVYLPIGIPPPTFAVLKYPNGGNTIYIYTIHSVFGMGLTPGIFW